MTAPRPASIALPSGELIAITRIAGVSIYHNDGIVGVAVEHVDGSNFTFAVATELSAWMWCVTISAAVTGSVTL